MSNDRGQRLVDQQPNIQFLSGAEMFGISGAVAFGIEYGKHDWQQLQNMEQRHANLKTAQGEIQEAGRPVAAQLREEYVSTIKSLGEHQNARPLPNDLERWYTPTVSSTLTEAEVADHNSWSRIKSSLRTIDLNNELKLPDATKLNDTAFQVARGYGRMPVLTELRFPEGMNVTPEGSRYNRLVGEFNERLDGMKSEHDAFKKIDMPRVRNAAIGTFGAIAVDTALDYTLLRDRTSSGLSFMTDMASPIASALLVRKFGPVPAFVGPVLAHVAEKYLYEKPTDSQGKVI